MAHEQDLQKTIIHLWHNPINCFRYKYLSVMKITVLSGLDWLEIQFSLYRVSRKTIATFVFSFSWPPIGLKGQPRTLLDSPCSVFYETILDFVSKCHFHWDIVKRVTSEKQKSSHFIENICVLVLLGYSLLQEVCINLQIQLYVSVL